MKGPRDAEVVSMQVTSTSNTTPASLAACDLLTDLVISSSLPTLPLRARSIVARILSSLCK